MNKPNYKKFILGVFVFCFSIAQSQPQKVLLEQELLQIIKAEAIDLEQIEISVNGVRASSIYRIDGGTIIKRVRIYPKSGSQVEKFRYISNKQHLKILVVNNLVIRAKGKLASKTDLKVRKIKYHTSLPYKTIYL